MSGYIQIEVNGKPVGLKWNMYALELLSDSKVESDRVSNYANVVKLVWAGYCGNCFAKQIEPTLSFEDVCEWVEILILDGDKEGMATKIVEAFTSSRAYQKLSEKQIEPEIKKKKRTGNESMNLSLVKSA